MGYTAATVDADRNVTVNRSATHNPVLVAIVVDRIMLVSTVVPDSDVAYLPAPPHGIFRGSDVGLEHLVEFGGIALGKADEALHEIAEQQRLLPGFRMDAHDRMLGLVDRRCENFLEVLLLFGCGARAHGCVVVGIAMNSPQIVRQYFERRRQILVRGVRVGPDRVAPPPPE